MKVVIVGGGFGGVDLALLLANQEGVEVSLISKSSNFEYHAALYRSATGRSPREVVIPLSNIFDMHDRVDIIQAEITQIDPDKKHVISEDSEQYHYDLLVLAVGQEINYFGIDGLEENSYSLDTIKNTIRLRQHIRDVVVNSSKQKPHFAVVGAGASGVELSAELNTFAHSIAKKNNLEPKVFKVSLIEGADRVLPALKPKISANAQKRLQTLGVDLMLNQKVQSADKTSLILESGKLEADTIIWTAGNRNNHLYRSHEHLFKFAKNTRVIVDKHLQVGKDIYVIGDSADTKYSGMAQTALHDAEYVAADIVAQLKNAVRVAYVPRMPIYIVPVGHRYAVFQSKHFTLYGFPAWIMRRAADFRLFTEFEPLKRAVKTWRKGNQRAVDY